MTETATVSAMPATPNPPEVCSGWQHRLVDSHARAAGARLSLNIVQLDDRRIFRNDESESEKVTRLELKDFAACPVSVPDSARLSDE